MMVFHLMDMLIELVLLLIISLLYLSNRKQTVKDVKDILVRDWKIFPIFAAAIAFSYPLTFLFTNLDLTSILGYNRALNVMLGTVSGIVFPGPRYIIYPFINQIINLGFGSGFIIALLYSQQLLSEPEGFVLEVKYFGKRYALFWALMIIGIVFSTVFIFEGFFHLTPIESFEVEGADFVNYMVGNMMEYLPILVLAVVLSGAISHKISGNIIGALGKGSKSKAILLVSIAGMLVPGPVYLLGRTKENICMERS